MPDFISDFWSWFIGLTTVFSIVGLFIFVIKLSKREKNDDAGQVKTMGHVWDEDLEEYNNPLPSWWLFLLLGTLVWGLGYIIFYPGLGKYAGILGWTSKGQFEQEIQKTNEQYGPLYEQFKNTDLVSLAHNEDALKIGERLYASYCTTCHGSDARGARGYPNLRDQDWLYGGSPEDIRTTIMNGRQGVMPPWGNILNDEDIFNVSSYVEQLSGREIDSKHASLGKDIFQKNCAMCHGAEGEGNYQFGAPNLTDDIWLYGGSQKKIIESIKQGRNGKMPANLEFLGEAKVHILAAYIYSLSNS